ncbi:MAG: DUF2723 domain-containing protein, partial [Chloroflexi bacterium]|nr:DUF2723 domain-containing protein [Chloroflexota bacterium]
MERIKQLWQSTWGAAIAAGALTAVLFAITLQTHINGGNHPYVTDVGELQNALPRWGTIHFSGYPLYSILGSLIVTLLRLVGVKPALGSSLVSLIFGAATAVLLAQTALELGAKKWAAVVGAVTASVAASMWIDSSLAEVHSMTMMFIMGIFYFALRFERTGERTDLLWLAFFFSQGVFHGRSVMGVIPAVFLLVIPHGRMIWKNALTILSISLVAPLLYLYLPLREWMGATWTFGNTSTWNGFLRALLNIKAGRFTAESVESFTWLEKIRVALSILNDDLPLALLGIGLFGLFFIPRKKWAYWRAMLAAHLIWLPFAVVPLFIYAGFVGDALLAVKLPVPLFAGLGLALLISQLHRWRRQVGYAALALVVAGTLYAGWRNYPAVVAITKDRTIEEKIAIADQAANPEEPTVMMILWGHSFWGAAYAQAYRSQIEDVTLVDHNAPFGRYIAEGKRLLTLSDTFYQRPVDWWEKILGSVYLSGNAPGLVEIKTEPLVTAVSPDATLFNLSNGILIRQASVAWRSDNELDIIIDWQAEREPLSDYSVAVHLVAQDPPTGSHDIIAQADRNHPVEGWYPTSRWQTGEIVSEYYRLVLPPDAKPTAVRVGMY